MERHPSPLTYLFLHMVTQEQRTEESVEEGSDKDEGRLHGAPFWSMKVQPLSFKSNARDKTGMT